MGAKADSSGRQNPLPAIISADKIPQVIGELVTAGQEKPARFGGQEVRLCVSVAHFFGAPPGIRDHLRGIPGGAAASMIAYCYQ
jgi:hypothetical protein